MKIKEQMQKHYYLILGLTNIAKIELMFNNGSVSKIKN